MISATHRALLHRHVDVRVLVDNVDELLETAEAALAALEDRRECRLALAPTLALLEHVTKAANDALQHQSDTFTFGIGSQSVTNADIKNSGTP